MPFHVVISGGQCVGHLYCGAYNDQRAALDKMMSVPNDGKCSIIDIEYWPEVAGRVEIVARMELLNGIWVQIPSPDLRRVFNVRTGFYDTSNF